MLKVFLVNAYIEIHKFDILLISETYLDSSTDSDVQIFGYTLVHSDYPSNNKRGCAKQPVFSCGKTKQALKEMQLKI